MLGEGLDLETVISSSLGISSSIFELSFLKASSFRETKQIARRKKFKIKRVMNFEVTQV
jgi:hypothetical protein